jgi:hypothetical protein
MLRGVEPDDAHGVIILAGEEILDNRLKVGAFAVSFARASLTRRQLSSRFRAFSPH